MPYHSQAVSMEWNELESGVQYLLLAMMRVMAGGYLSIGILIITGQYLFNRHKHTYLPLLIFSCGMLVCLTSGYATLLVKFHTPGRPPIIAAIIGLILLIVAFIFNRQAVRQSME